MAKEYSVARQILEGIGNKGEGVYSALVRGAEAGARISPRVLGRVLDSSAVSLETKTVALRLLSDASEAKETRRDAIEVIGSVRVMFRVAEMFREGVEAYGAAGGLESARAMGENITSLTRILQSAAGGEKDALVQCMDECGVFILANVWTGSALLQLYSAVYAEEIPPRDVRSAGKARRRKHREETPYRMLAEENTPGVGTILAHRRERPLFTPQWFEDARERRPCVYSRLFQFQDEYEIVYKCIVAWCEENGSLEKVAWGTVWYLWNLGVYIEKDATYEEESVFILGPVFFSSLQNSFVKEGYSSICLLNQYLKLLRAGKECGVPRIRGVAGVAAERIGMEHIKMYLHAITSSKALPATKSAAAHGLYLALRGISEDTRRAAEKAVEKHVIPIAELLEIQPSGNEASHSTDVLGILSYVSTIPLCLYRPSVMVLMAWTAQHVSLAEKRQREWLERYIEEGCRIYNPEKPDFLLTGLGL